MKELTESDQTERLRQPKALYLLFAMRMWECFSFYGMRALLVLYMVSELGFNDMRAYGIFALYSSLTEFGAILGGRLADKLLGLRPAIAIGGWVMAAGHLTMAFEENSLFLFLGLSLIVVGSGLFTSNISALLGLFYTQNDSRREQGFTLFYVGINVGALLASLLCGYIGETYGWHYGFGLAAIGMTVGNLMFIAFGKVLENKGNPPKKIRKREKSSITLALIALVPIMAIVIAREEIFMHILPWICMAIAGYMVVQMGRSGAFTKSKLAMLGLYLTAFVLFFAAEDQVATSLLMFSERHAEGTIAGFEMPSSSLLSLNPFVIILGGSLVARLFRNSGLQSIALRSVAALVMGSAAFAGLTLLCTFNADSGTVPVIAVAGVVILISMAELLIAPAIYSFCSEMAPEEWQGSVMGLIPIGFSLASLMSGFFSKSMAMEEGTENISLTLFTQGFGIISVCMGVMALIVMFGIPALQKYLKEDKSHESLQHLIQ